MFYKCIHLLNIKGPVIIRSRGDNYKTVDPNIVLVSHDGTSPGEAMMLISRREMSIIASPGPRRDKVQLEAKTRLGPKALKTGLSQDL